MRLWEVPAGAQVATLAGEHTAKGDFAQTFALLDESTLALLKSAKIPTAPKTEARLARPLTKDFYAFTLFGRGLVALHGLGKPSNPAKAEKEITRALFIDPKFAEDFETRGKHEITLSYTFFPATDAPATSPQS